MRGLYLLGVVCAVHNMDCASGNWTYFHMAFVVTNSLLLLAAE
jgi:hypothetical protein